MMKPTDEITADVTANTTLQVARGPISTAIPGEAVILDSRSGRYFGLEGVGARVWELLQTPRPLDEVVRVVLDEYEVDEATCKRDLTALIAELRSAGLVAADSSNTGSGTSQ